MQIKTRIYKLAYLQTHFIKFCKVSSRFIGRDECERIWPSHPLDRSALRASGMLVYERNIKRLEEEQQNVPIETGFELETNRPLTRLWIFLGAFQGSTVLYRCVDWIRPSRIMNMSRLDQVQPLENIWVTKRPLYVIPGRRGYMQIADPTTVNR